MAYVAICVFTETPDQVLYRCRRCGNDEKFVRQIDARDEPALSRRAQNERQRRGLPGISGRWSHAGILARGTGGRIDLSSGQALKWRYDLEISPQTLASLLIFRCPSFSMDRSRMRMECRLRVRKRAKVGIWSAIRV